MLRRGEKQPKKKSDIRLRRQSKGLVAVLAVELKNVLPPSFITGSSLEEIYFADKNGDYHDRNTKLPEWQVESEVEKIHKYYKAFRKIPSCIFLKAITLNTKRSVRDKMLKLLHCGKSL